MNPSQRHACSRCRASKLRCLLDTLSEHGKCRRCYNAGAACIFESVAPRQQRKRTDTRVAVLEKQLAGLKDVIANPSNHRDPSAGWPANALQNNLSFAQGATGHRYGGERPEQHMANTGHSERGERRLGDNDSSSPRHETIPGLVTTNQLPWDLAISLLNEYTSRVIPEYPIVAIPDGDDFNSLRASQPTLLLAMVTAAARGSDPVLFRKLHSRLIGHLADQILVQGRRSLELVQAILVMEVWYDPPDDMARLNFYMWIQVMGVMIRQLGLWPVSEVSSGATLRELGERGTQEMGQCRTAFAVFLSNSTAAISLRRPLTLPWTEEMLKTLDQFEKSSTHVNDRRLVAWVRLQIIAEDIETSRLKLLNASKRAVGGDTDPVDQPIVQTLEARLSEWRYSNWSIMNSSLQVHFSYCRTKFYELDVLLCRTQMHSRSIMTSHVQTQNNRFRNMTYVRVLMSLVQSCHAVLDTVLNLDIPTYLRCPTVTTVRALYALQEIYALWKSIHVHQTYLADVINEEVLAPKFYAKQIRDFFERAARENRFQIPRMALASLTAVTDDVLLGLSGETHQHQEEPPRPTLDPHRRTREPTSAPLNDMDVILTMDITSSEPDTHLSPSVHDLGLLDSNEATTDESPFQPQLFESCSLSGFGGSGNDAPMLSEFEMMALPSAVIDPSWLFPAEGYFLGSQRE